MAKKAADYVSKLLPVPSKAPRIRDSTRSAARLPWLGVPCYGRDAMWVRDLADCDEFTSGDQAALREIFHPDKDSLEVRFSLAHAEVAPGRRTRPHRLRTAEVYYILAGRGLMHVAGETAEVGPGYAVYIPPGAVQFIANPGPDRLTFLCLVDPAWRPEDEAILE